MIEQFNLSRLSPATKIKPFDCNNQDLNDFLYDDAKDHMQSLVAVTYLLESEQETIAYFSVLNDSIRKGDTTNSHMRKILKFIPHKKRGYKSHPAVKIGRIAVNKKYQRQKVGTELMTLIKGFFLINNKTGCRFITLDAENLPGTIKFYQDNGFDFLTTQDEKEPTRIMFFDLIRFTSYIKNPLS